VWGRCRQGTLEGDINYAYDGLASTFQMNTTFELDWTSKSMKRAQMAGKIHPPGVSCTSKKRV
jgi:hypothetical protein